MVAPARTSRESKRAPHLLIARHPSKAGVPGSPRTHIAPNLQHGQLHQMKHPEAQFVVEVTAADEIVCRAPGQAEQRISIEDLGAVYVETTDRGPWGADVWWLLNDRSGQTMVAFPQTGNWRNRRA